MQPYDLDVDDPLSLPDDEVHLWCADPEEAGASDVEAAGRPLLSSDELQRLERFVFARDRSAYLASRMLVRGVLSRYGRRAPSAWQFASNAHGRPEIAGSDSRLRFNISHTTGLVVCAVTRARAVGVDAEDLRRAAPLDVVQQVLAPREIDAMRALPVERQPRRLFEYWTLKESYVKALGLGLNLALDQVAFANVDGERPALVHDDGLWQFMQLWTAAAFSTYPARDACLP
jgi:4'-phosphopantetheinyl transferase